MITDEHILFGGGANGATPGVFDRGTFKKVGGLKGHKSMLSGLARFADHYVTLGGRNARPFDDTLRLWDPKTLAETARIKLTRHPRAVAAGPDRMVVHAWSHADHNALHAYDPAGHEVWKRDLGDGYGACLSMSPSGEVLALLRGSRLALLDRDGEERASCDVSAAGHFRMAGSWGPPAFSHDERYLFLTPEYDESERGTFVIDVATCALVLQLRGVVRPAPLGEGYGAWLGTTGPVTHFGVLPKDLVEP